MGTLEWNELIKWKIIFIIDSNNNLCLCAVFAVLCNNTCAIIEINNFSGINFQWFFNMQKTYRSTCCNILIRINNNWASLNTNETRYC